jgi:UDP-2,3-diacylglucosamine pyrophosphatase LpxH
VSFGQSKISFAHQVKRSVKQAVKFISDFEKQAIRMGIKKQVDAVICGHIHQPCIEDIKMDGQVITYMNSGDWVENMTALECLHGKWSLYHFGQTIEPAIHEYLRVLEDDQYIFIPDRKLKSCK